MIMRDDIRKGLLSGKIRLVVDPNMESGTVCQIGDNWFYFGGQTAEEMSPEEYSRCVPVEDIISEILDVLAEFEHNVDFQYEYLYYAAVLGCVNIIKDE